MEDLQNQLDTLSIVEKSSFNIDTFIDFINNKYL